MAQGGVAGDAAMALVDRLEIVEIDREQGRRRAVARGLAEHALELADELARVEQRGERVAAGILLEVAEPGAGLGERGAQQRILVGQPRQRLARLARGLLGRSSRRHRLRTVLSASHGGQFIDAKVNATLRPPAIAEAARAG